MKRRADSSETSGDEATAAPSKVQIKITHGVTPSRFSTLYVNKSSITIIPLFPTNVFKDWPTHLEAFSATPVFDLMPTVVVALDAHLDSQHLPWYKDYVGMRYHSNIMAYYDVTTATLYERLGYTRDHAVEAREAWQRCEDTMGLLFVEGDCGSGVAAAATAIPCSIGDLYARYGDVRPNKSFGKPRTADLPALCGCLEAIEAAKTVVICLRTSAVVKSYPGDVALTLLRRLAVPTPDHCLHCYHIRREVWLRFVAWVITKTSHMPTLAIPVLQEVQKRGNNVFAGSFAEAYAYSDMPDREDRVVNEFHATNAKFKNLARLKLLPNTQRYVDEYEVYFVPVHDTEVDSCMPCVAAKDLNLHTCVVVFVVVNSPTPSCIGFYNTKTQRYVNVDGVDGMSVRLMTLPSGTVCMNGRDAAACSWHLRVTFPKDFPKVANMEWGTLTKMMSTRRLMHTPIVFISLRGNAEEVTGPGAVFLPDFVLLRLATGTLNASRQQEIWQYVLTAYILWNFDTLAGIKGVGVSGLQRIVDQGKAQYPMALANVYAANQVLHDAIIEGCIASPATATATAAAAVPYTIIPEDDEVLFHLANGAYEAETSDFATVTVAADFIGVPACRASALDAEAKIRQHRAWPSSRRSVWVNACKQLGMVDMEACVGSAVASERPNKRQNTQTSEYGGNGGRRRKSRCV